MCMTCLLRVREFGLDKPKPLSEVKLKLNFPSKKINKASLSCFLRHLIDCLMFRKFPFFFLNF